MIFIHSIALSLANNSNTASPAYLKTLDLYAHLSSMPKSSAEDKEGEEEASQGRGKKKQPGAEVAASKRQLGRLKNKRALEKVVEGSMGRDGDNEKDGEREVKRTRSENADPGGEGGDVAMDES